MQGEEAATAVRAAALAGVALEALVMAGLGLRLLVRFVRSGAPTGFVGIALLFGAVPAQVLLALLAEAGSPPSRGLWQLVYAGFYMGIGVGGVSILRFAHEIFRPRSRALSAAGVAVAGYFALLACTLPFEADAPREEPASLVGLAAVVAIFAWTAGESLRAWSRYRYVPGLDPAVVESFRLWGVAALGGLALVVLLHLAARHPLALVGAALAGLLCCAALWLAFLPPAAWRRRLEARLAPPPRPAARGPEP